MADKKHAHAWENFAEYYPRGHTSTDASAEPNDEPDLSGSVGYEMDVPYRVEVCGCGEKRVVALSDDEAQALGIRVGTIVHDTLTLSQEGGQS